MTFTLASFTPAGLVYTKEPHRYEYLGRLALSVTQCLRDAALVNAAMFTDDDRMRGRLVHEQIERIVRGYQIARLDSIDGYVRAFETFLAESAFRVDASEESLIDPQLMVAGTLDLRGQFVTRTTTPAAAERIDLIDVKTGTAPTWVGYQLAGYQRLLPEHVRSRCRRWSLELHAGGSYRLWPHVKTSDERIFMAAVVVAQAKAGWL